MHFFLGVRKYKVCHINTFNVLTIVLHSYLAEILWRKYSIGFIRLYCTLFLYVVWFFVLYVAGLRDSRESWSVDPGHQSGRILYLLFIYTPIKNLYILPVVFLVLKICNIRDILFFFYSWFADSLLSRIQRLDCWNCFEISGSIVWCLALQWKTQVSCTYKCSCL